MDYGRMKFFPNGKSPNVPDYTNNSTEDTSLVEVFLRGSFLNPEVWGIFADGTEKQLGGSGYGVLKNFTYGHIATKYTALNENVKCSGYIYAYPMAFGGAYKFNRMRIKLGVAGVAIDRNFKAVIYNSDATVKLFEGTTATINNNLGIEYLTLQFPEINESNCGQTPRIALAIESVSNICLGYANQWQDNIPLVYDLAGDLANIPEDLSAVGSSLSANIGQPYFELYYEEV